MRFQIIALLALSLQDTEQTLFFLGPLLNLFGGGGIKGGRKGLGGGLLGGFLGGGKGGGLLGGLLGGGGGGPLGGFLGGSKPIINIGSQQISTAINTESNPNFNSGTDLNSQLNSIRFRPRGSSSTSTTVNSRRIPNTDNVDQLDEQFDEQPNNNNIDDIQDEQVDNSINNSQSNTRTTNTRRTRNGGLNINTDQTFLPNNRRQANTRIRTNTNNNTNRNINANTNIGSEEQDGDTLNQDDINNLSTSSSATKTSKTADNRRNTSRNRSNNRINTDNISVNSSNPSNIRRAANNQRTTNRRTDISRDLINAMRNNNMPDVEVNGRVISGQEFIKLLQESQIFINGQKTSAESLIRALNGEQNIFVNGLDREVRVNQRRVDPKTMTDISTGNQIDVKEDAQYQTVQISDQNV